MSQKASVVQHLCVDSEHARRAMFLMTSITDLWGDI